MTDEPTQSLEGEILQGVDMIGTMLHDDIPRLEEELKAIRARLEERPAAVAEVASTTAPDDVQQALEELRDLIQLQTQRIEALERRVAQWTAGAAEGTTSDGGL